MIVVAVIGILAALALPAFKRVRDTARSRRFISDLRTFSQAFETYALEKGAWPPDATEGVIPTGMAGRLRAGDWQAINSIGGQWDWDCQQFGYTAGISCYQPTFSLAQMQEIDRLIDDGNLSTGNFRARSNGYIWILEF